MRHADYMLDWRGMRDSSGGQAALIPGLETAALMAKLGEADAAWIAADGAAFTAEAHRRRPGCRSGNVPDGPRVPHPQRGQPGTPGGRTRPDSSPSVSARTAMTTEPSSGRLTSPSTPFLSQSSWAMPACPGPGQDHRHQPPVRSLGGRSRGAPPPQARKRAVISCRRVGGSGPTRVEVLRWERRLLALLSSGGVRTVIDRGDQGDCAWRVHPSREQPAPSRTALASGRAYSASIGP